MGVLSAFHLRSPNDNIDHFKTYLKHHPKLAGLALCKINYAFAQAPLALVKDKQLIYTSKHFGSFLEKNFTPLFEYLFYLAQGFIFTLHCASMTDQEQTKSSLGNIAIEMWEEVIKEQYESFFIYNLKDSIIPAIEEVNKQRRSTPWILESSDAVLDITLSLHELSKENLLTLQTGFLQVAHQTKPVKIISEDYSMKNYHSSIPLLKRLHHECYTFCVPSEKLLLESISQLLYQQPQHIQSVCEWVENTCLLAAQTILSERASKNIMNRWKKELPFFLFEKKQAA